MNALHLTLATFGSHTGVGKKIKAQAQAIQNCGFERAFIGMIDDNLWFNIDGQRVGKIARVSDIKGQLHYFKKIEAFVIDNKIQFIYYRFNALSDPFVIMFFRRMKRSGVRCVMEIPTYPYDGEVKNKNRLTYLDIFTRRFLAKQFQYIVTFSSDDRIFGQKTIRISNGIDFSTISIRRPEKHEGFVMLGVANLRYWHGFDRIIRGLKEYVSKVDSEKVKFYIVSGAENEDIKELKLLVDSLDLNDIVVFKGEVWGQDLDELFNISDVAIGSLGRHRNGIRALKTLKNVEYAVRGIPFIYSENNSDFDGRPYIIKASQDDSSINIENLIEFIRIIDSQPELIRSTVADLSWESQMHKILNTVYNEG